MIKLAALIIIFLSTNSFAQNAELDTSSEPSLELESLYDEQDKEEEKKSEVEQETKKKERETIDKSEEGTLAELKILAPFENIAIIQKRFMPKTNRFEFSGALGNSLNNAFFNNWGLVTRVAYYLTEHHGLELQYFWLNSNEREITESLRDKQRVQTRSLVVPESYMGLSYKWLPIYGKVALFNKRIVPFDLYFSAGGGLSETGLGEQEPTIQLGTGQKFYLTKSTAFRWDFALNSYRARILQDTSGTGDLEEASKMQIDLFITVGMSFYWPGATYR